MKITFSLVNQYFHVTLNQLELTLWEAPPEYYFYVSKDEFVKVRIEEIHED